jgi:polysaccharide pyruvyl transferase WcaK-like protein
MNNYGGFNTEQPTYPVSILMGFRFFGAGNIGDDLMIGGFLQAISNLDLDAQPSLYSCTRHNVESQRSRFPEISWSHTDQKKVYDPALIECWAGVGDTPFQITSGDWSLNLLLSDLSIIEQFKRRVLVGIGAEEEIEPRAKDFSRIANAFEKISTRDEHSTRILVDMLGVSSSRVYTGSDLANISLSVLLKDKTINPEFSLGLIIAGDTLSKKDIKEIGQFIANQSEPLAFIAGETRLEPSFERGIFAKLTRFPWSRVRGKAILQVPSYERGSLYDIIKPICACETVISTRYHGLLTAAWAGRKVAAIGRASKVVALAKLLRVPYCELPVTQKKLEFLQQEASIVSPKLLEEFREIAFKGVCFSLGKTENGEK